MVLPYGGRVGWRRIMKAVMIYIVTAFFYLIILAIPNGYWQRRRRKGKCIGYAPSC